jgi:hypothetical protein
VVAKAKLNGTSPAEGRNKGDQLMDEIMGRDGEGRNLTIAAAKFDVAEFLITGDAPYVQNKFSQKAMDIMKEAQMAGGPGRNKRKREGKDFEQAYRGAMHVTAEGWCGIPAPAFRNAMISACRTVGYKMTLARLSIFIMPNGFDMHDGTPLVRITKGEPRMHEGLVRLQTGVADIRVRPMWEPGWEATIGIRFDADQFTHIDIANLLMRVGVQVGVGEGRPDSKNSAGMGWGTFTLNKGDD